MVPFYRSGSTISRLQSHYKESVFFLPLSLQEYRWKSESTLEPTSGFLNPRPLDWESSTLTTRPLLQINFQTSIPLRCLDLQGISQEGKKLCDLPELGKKCSWGLGCTVRPSMGSAGPGGKPHEKLTIFSLELVWYSLFK